MPTPSDAPGAAFPEDARSQEGIVGGADAVQKTSYVVGKGTDPEARRAPGEMSPALSQPASSARGWIIALLLVVAGGLVYLLAR
jgi:hypothetical protein